MDLVKGVRVPERAYRALLWLVSIVFAGFIVGLGNLVIGDLPLVDRQVVAEAPAQTPEQQRLGREIATIEASRGEIDDKLEIARLKLEQAQRASANGTQTFSAWIATRTATENPEQDTELLARTRQLEQLKAAERATEAEIAALENARLPLDQRQNALQTRISDIETAALPAHERAMFMAELRVFLLRLLITLPMLAVAVWMVAKKRKSDHWPLMRGFVLAAVFVFFVELVPYLPSYGGYVRYAVGILLTFVAGHFLVKNMRTYLARRQATRRRPSRSGGGMSATTKRSRRWRPRSAPAATGRPQPLATPKPTSASTAA
jgi:hypothetical protein